MLAVTLVNTNFPLERRGIPPHHGACSALPHGVVYDPCYHQEEVFGDGDYFYEDDHGANFDPMYFPAWASYGWLPRSTKLVGSHIINLRYHNFMVLITLRLFLDWLIANDHSFMSGKMLARDRVNMAVVKFNRFTLVWWRALINRPSHWGLEWDEEGDEKCFMHYCYK